MVANVKPLNFMENLERRPKPPTFRDIVSALRDVSLRYSLFALIL